MWDALDAEGLSKGAPVGRSEVLEASLGTSVGLPLMEGVADALGAADLFGLEDTLGVLEVEGPNKGAPVSLPEALNMKFEKRAEAPLWF